MKHFKLCLTALILSAVVLFLILLGSVSVYIDSFQESRRAASIAQEEAREVETQVPVEKAPELLFDLKYDKYLVTSPYTYEVNGMPRRFQFEKMLGAIAAADLEMKIGRLAYVDNYKNRNGYAPYYHGKSADLEGNRRGAAAPAYFNEGDTQEFIYLSDGALTRIIEEDAEYAKVVWVGDPTGRVYFVPSKYVAADDCITELTKAIVVDRGNQNIAAFEKYYNNGADPSNIWEYQWKVVSYSMATTGKVGKYHELTPLGYYYAMDKKPHFYYLKDGTQEIEGYAPYAIRFAGGAYVHGVAVPYKYTADGGRIDPGIQEFSNSIGTIPLSHKCVRNYTSHAKFLYDWYEHGKTIVIVIE